MTLKTLLASAAVLAGLAVAGAASANTQIVLAPSDVIGSSGFYTACCTFNSSNILDQQTGPVTESFGGGYWLNPDNGPANAYITIDLGADYKVSDLQLFETHNGGYGDRGTGDFTIIGSNSVSGDDSTLTGTVVTLASGTLTATATAPDGSPVIGQTFAASGDTVRYIQFLPTSVATINTPCCGANVYGLDELRVFSGVPETATWALMLVGFGGVGATLRASRRKAAAACA